MGSPIISRELTASEVRAIGTKLYACLFISAVVEHVTYENACPTQACWQLSFGDERTRQLITLQLLIAQS